MTPTSVYVPQSMRYGIFSGSAQSRLGSIMSVTSPDFSAHELQWMTSEEVVTAGKQ